VLRNSTRRVMYTLSIVIPAKNEAENILALIDGISGGNISTAMACIADSTAGRCPIPR